MRIRLGLSFIAILFINMLLFSNAAHAVSFSRFSLKLNGMAVVPDAGNGKNKRLFVSLGRGFSIPKSYNPVLKYSNAGSYRFECGGAKLKSGGICRLGSVRYGTSTHTIKLFNGKILTDTYTLVFTNLPVIEINTANPIVNTPKVAGSFRLISGEFNQDTGKLAMGIDIRGQTSQVYSKKSFGVQFKRAKKSAKIRLLNMPAADEWVLDASYADTSFARNNISMDIFNEIHPNKDRSRPKGQNAIKGYPTEAIINGQYAGIYMLDQNVDPTLLGLKSSKGSFIYKANFAQWKKDLFYPYNKGQIELNFTQTYPATKADFTPLKNLIDFVVKSDEYTFTDNIGRYIDLTSVADWYLLVKATQASDNTSKNFFLAKNAGGKFFIVPWDHNATFGMFWDGKPEPTSTFFATVDNNLINRLIKYPDTNFKALLKSRWSVLRKTVFTKDKLLTRFTRYNVQLARGGALARNRVRWPQPGTVGANKGVSNPRLSTRQYIDNFLKVRLPAMNDYINGL